jgi:hypothetical protein
MGRIKIALASCFALFLFAAHLCDTAEAAGIRVIPSSARVVPGGDFYFDVVAEGIPAEGLGGVQFRINLSAPGSSVTGVTDLSQGGPADIAIASPLLISQPTSSRSGIGDFFWNGLGNNGILVMDNEPLTNGSALYTFAHTNGATPPSGSGSVARFMVRVGSGVTAEHVDINLSDVMLLDGGPVYPLDYNTGASVQLRCMTKVPSLLGLSLGQAQAALASANLLPGNIYELDNQTGNHLLNVVLEQSATAGSDLYCQTPVNLAINTPPVDVSRAVAADKPGDDTGAVLLSWAPSTSGDIAGYRVYQGSTLLRDINNPAATGTEAGGLATGVTSQLRITAYDTFGNESTGVTVPATPIDDVPPTVTITGVAEGAYYRTDVTPQVSVFDNNLASQSITLNGAPYVPASITGDGSYTLTVTGTDRAGNQTTKSVRFTIDKTPPTIAVLNVSNGGAYNVDITPTVTVTDANLKGSSMTLNGQPFAPGMPVTAEGSYALAISAEDLAGNIANQSIGFIIDKTPPSSQANAALPKYTNNGVLYISSQTPLTISAQDTGIAPSGVAGIDYGLDGAQSLSSYATPITLAGIADGSHSVTYRAYDRATNRESTHTLVATVDNTPPATSISLSGPSYLLAVGVYAATSATMFNLQATDLLSGVAKTEYRLDGGQWLPYAPFALSGEGAHVIDYRSADNLGNTETVKSQSAIIDNTPPVSTLSVGTLQFTSPDGTLYGSAATSFTIAASDNLSGVARTEYRIDGGAWTSYASFTIAVEGKHVIGYRSVDNVGNVETEKTLAVTIDNTPPLTAIKTGMPQFTAQDGSLYVTYAATFTLAASDNLSGVARTEYRLDGGAWSPYAPFTIATEGKHVIGYRSVDNVGNVEPEKTLTVTIDNTPPATAIKTGTPQFTGPDGTFYATSATSFTLTASDNLSGVARTEYRLDGGAWSPYAPFTIATEGKHVIGYRSVDNVGNLETEKTLTVTIDNTPPATAIMTGAPQFTGPDGTLYATSATSFTLTASDNLSGVARTEYRLDGGAWTAYALFTVATEGKHVIGYRSADNVGNVETEKTLAITIDNTPPVTAIKTGMTQFTAQDGSLYVTSATSFTLTASDNLSGVARTEYRLDGGAWTPYALFTLPTEGKHVIGYRSVDNVGNVEPEKTLTVTIDNTPPVTAIKTGTPQFTAVDGTLYATSATSFTLSATDNLSGVAKTEYRLDGGAWTPYAPFTIATEGKHVIGYRSADNVGNLETEKTLTVAIDNTPPVTVIKTGTPQFTGPDGTLYATSATSFTLSASDNLSGAARTEYRLDGGAWTPYAPFTIPTEGKHVIGYRSVDNVGNLETEKTLTVTIDNTPPVSLATTGTPQYAATGNLYVNGGTGIALTATDNSSGVKMSEYSIDSAPFVAYSAPIILAAYPEGSHTIAYRSTDNLGNQEKAKQLTVILDKTPPKTIIAGSEPLVDGVVNTVSPVTSFSLTATDNISGVKGIWYRIDSGQWQLFTNGFTLAGLKEGRHIISFSAVDNVTNEEPEQAITVRLIIMEVTKGISAEPLVLVAPSGKEDRDEDGRRKEADPLLPILDSLGISYYAAKDDDDFALALRSGRYNTYLLTDDREKEAEEELHEGVYFGDGLLIIKTRPDNDHDEDDVAGVKFTGRTAAHDLTVTLTESPFSKAATFPSSGKTVIAKVTSATAKVYGTVTDKRGLYPAVIFNEYGRGKVMLFTFDLLAIADHAKRAELLASALALVNPSAHYLRPLDTVPLTTRIKNTTEPVGLDVTETIPKETTADLPTPPGASSGNLITWRQYLGALETARFGYYLNLPDAKGEYTATTDVRYANYGEYRPYSSHDLTLKVETTSTDLLQGVKADLMGLPTTDKGDRKRINEALSELCEVRQNAATAEAAKDNLEKLTEAAEEIADLTVTCREVRLKLDELIKIWQRKWYLMKSVEKRDRKDD